MRVVLTGGRGLIGSWAVHELVGAGHHVTSVIRQEAEVPRELNAPQVEVVADAGDPIVLRDACHGADGVVHLAAIPGPVGHTARELMGANTLTTVSVLEAAGNAGVRGAVIASSVSALGMAWSDATMSPLYLPVDEDHPLRPTEGYALSKECDEAAARMAARRWGMTAFALRFPFTHTAQVIRERVANPTLEQARVFAKELWGYLDVRDAARAVRLALETAVESQANSSTVLNIAADDVCFSEPLAELVARWHPTLGAVPPNVRGAYDTTRAEALIGFTAHHLVNHAH